MKLSEAIKQIMQYEIAYAKDVKNFETDFISCSDYVIRRIVDSDNLCVYFEFKNEDKSTTIKIKPCEVVDRIFIKKVEKYLEALIMLQRRNKEEISQLEKACNRIMVDVEVV